MINIIISILRFSFFFCFNPLSFAATTIFRFHFLCLSLSFIHSNSICVRFHFHCAFFIAIFSSIIEIVVHHFLPNVSMRLYCIFFVMLLQLLRLGFIFIFMFCFVLNIFVVVGAMIMFRSISIETKKRYAISNKQPIQHVSDAVLLLSFFSSTCRIVSLRKN